MSEVKLDEYWTEQIEKEIFPKVFKDVNDFIRRYTFDAKQAENDLINAALKAKMPIPYDIKRTLASFYTSLMTLVPPDNGPKVG